MHAAPIPDSATMWQGRYLVHYQKNPAGQNWRMTLAIFSLVQSTPYFEHSLARVFGAPVPYESLDWKPIQARNNNQIASSSTRPDTRHKVRRNTSIRGKWKGVTDVPTDGRTERRTDRPSSRGASSHLRRPVGRNLHLNTGCSATSSVIYWNVISQLLVMLESSA